MMRRLELASQCCFNNIILESDCEVVIREICGDLCNYRCWGKMVKKIKSYLAMFQSYKFQFTKRDNNSVAHYLAKQAHLEGSKTWKIALLPSIIVHPHLN